MLKSSPNQSEPVPLMMGNSKREGQSQRQTMHPTPKTGNVGVIRRRVGTRNLPRAILELTLELLSLEQWLPASQQRAMNDDFYESEKKKRKSKRANEIFDDDDVRSVASTPATADEKKSRLRSKRDSEIFDDDDTRSVASSPADSKKSKSKDKDKDKRSSGGIWGSIFGNKSDVSVSSKKSSKSSKSEGRAERDQEDGEKRKKRRSKGTDFDDTGSAASEPTRRSRRDSTPLAEQRQAVADSRDQSVDDGFVSAEESATQPDEYPHEQESFLAERPDMPQQMAIPMATDGVSGLKTEGPAVRPLDMHVASRDLPEDDSLEITDQITPLESSPETRRISALKTVDLPSSPVVASSPTAVPLLFRRLPMSPGTPRASLSSPVASPSSPMTTPRTRQSRPHSTEFRSSKEIRPLYLVQKTKAAMTPRFDIEEDLPSLPSSRTSSAHPSMEDLRGQAKAAEAEDYFGPERITPEKLRERGRRHSYSYWRDEPRRTSPDYLDSRSATPVPTDVQRFRDAQPKKQKPKYEFHSPSELLQDPAMSAELADMNKEPERLASPLPSVISTEHDQDFMSAHGSPTLSRAESVTEGRQARPRSRSRSRSRPGTMVAAGLGIAAGSALGLAASEVLSRDEGRRSMKSNMPDMDDTYAADPPPSAPSPPPTAETPAEITEAIEEQKRDLFDEPNPPSESATPASEAEGPSETPPGEIADWPPTKKSKKEKRKSKGKKDIVEPDSKPEPESQFAAEPEQSVPAPIAGEEEWAPSTCKKSKKDKKKDKRKGSLPPLDIARAEAKDESGERLAKLDDDEPLTAVPSEMSQSRELPAVEPVHDPAIEEIIPQTEAVVHDLDSRRVSVPEQSAEEGDLTLLEHHQSQNEQPEGIALGREATLDLPTDFSEHASRVSFPWDDQEAASTPLPEDQDRELDFILEEQSSEPERPRLRNFVPSSELLNQPKNELGAFEEAFERAILARGLGDNITRDDALDAFLPKRNNAPFMVKGALTPIAQSLATTPASTPPVEESLQEAASSSKKSNKEDRKSKKASKKNRRLRDTIAEEDETPENEDSPRDQVVQDAALSMEPKPTSEQLMAVARALAAQDDVAAMPEHAVVAAQDPNPFGNDFEIREDEVVAPVAVPVADSVRNIKPQALASGIDVAVEPKVEEAAEEFSWAPISKKDKKKKKKGQSSTPAQISTPAEQTPIENPRELGEGPEEQFDDSWVPSTSKKGKKDKKRSTLDWTEAAAPALAGGAIGAGAATTTLQDDDKEKEIVAEPEDIPDTRFEEPYDNRLIPEVITAADNVQDEPARETTPDYFSSFTPTGKKGKKNNKKSKSSAFDWDTPQGDVPTLGEPQIEGQQKG